MIFTAQSSETNHENPIELNGVMLQENDEFDRTNAMLLISEISERGTCVFSEDAVTVWVDRLYFLIEIPTIERDVTGRATSVVGCGMHAEASDPTKVVAALKTFAVKIGRSIAQERMRLSVAGVATVGRNIRNRKIAYIALGFSFFVCSIVAVVILLL